MFTKSDFDALEKVVDAFSLMTYDYSNPQRYYQRNQGDVSVVFNTVIQM